MICMARLILMSPPAAPGLWRDPAMEVSIALPTSDADRETKGIVPVTLERRRGCQFVIWACAPSWILTLEKSAPNAGSSFRRTSARIG